RRSGFRYIYAGADSVAIRVVDQSGSETSKPALTEILEPLVERHLADLDVLSPLIVKIPPSGGAWLYAYVDRERGLRVQLPAALLAELERKGATDKVCNSIAQRVRDLAANLRSRAGSSSQYFRRATKTLPAIDRE
ncbi:MAG: hypothetical protein AAFP04_03785, partial [Myxococcota bacterium]